jgi:hypothetical protein
VALYASGAKVSNNALRRCYTAFVPDGFRRKQLMLFALGAGVMIAAYAVHGFWRRELSHLTGPAEWIWVTDVLDPIHAQSALFVASLRLEAPPPAALLKVCGDREYVVYVNGTPAACGWSRPGFRLDLYDIGHLLKQGENVLTVEVRSPTPVGALLLALDVDGVGRNVLVSGRAFSVRSHFALGAKDSSDRPVPVSWGMPPRFPWGYPPPLPHPRTLDEAVVEDPVRVRGAEARLLPGGGWEFVLPRAVRGYLWLEFGGDGMAFVATANAGDAEDPEVWRGEASPVVRVKGQRSWLDPQPQPVSRVYVFGQERPTAVEVWPVSEQFSSAAPGVVPGSFGPVPRTRWTIRTHPE